MTTEEHEEKLRTLELVHLKKFITVKEAILLTSFSRSTIHKLRMNNKIKWYRVPSGSKSKENGVDGPVEAKKVLILKQSLFDYFESCSNHFNNG